MKRRDSMRRVTTRKFFISTVPFGKSQSLLDPTVMVVLLGNAIQRSLLALSDQNGALIEYGTSPEAGCCAFAGFTQPVALSMVGAVPPPVPPWKTMRCRVPPV